MTARIMFALRALFVLLIICRGYADSPDTGELEGTIPIVDESLGAAVFSSSSALGRGVDATSIKSLRPVWNSPIRDLSGLECLTHLEFIDIRNQRVKDLKPVAGLSELRSLYLSGNLLDSGDSLTPLLDLPKLRVLLLDHNRLNLSGPQGDVVNALRNRGVYVSTVHQSELGPPPASAFRDPALEIALRELIEKPEGSLTNSDFDGLVEIDLGEWCIQDLRGIEMVHDLERLVFRNGAVSAVAETMEALGKLKKLTYLDVTGSMPYSIASFVGVPSGLLADLELVESSKFYGTRPCADERVSEFGALDDDWLNSGGVVDPERTRVLVLSNNKLRELGGIERFSALTTLVVPGNLITNIERLRVLDSLRLVDLRENDLDLSDGSPAALTISHLRGRDVTVLADAQRPNAVVTISDNTIAAIVRDRLGLGKNAPIMSRQLRTLSRLELNDLGTLELTGVENAIGLTSLDLRGNFVAARPGDSDFGVVTELRNAGVTVDISSTFHPDLKTRFPNPYLIDNLFPRIGIYLRESQAENMSVKRVSLFDENETRDLRGLETLPFLEQVKIFLRPDGTMPTLSVESQQVLDKLQAKGVAQLTQLDVDFRFWNSLKQATGSDNPSSEDIAKLEELDVVGAADDDDWSPVSRIDGLQSAVNLRHLRISNRENVRDLSPIKGLIALETFEAPNNRITSLEALEDASDLSRLDVSGNRNLDPKPALKNFPLLRELDASFTAYKPGLDLDALDELEYLALDGLGLRNEDIEFGTLHDVTTLSLAANALDRASVVASYKSLVSVDLSFNQIRDATAPEWPGSLESLTLDANRLSSWDWLEQLPPLKRLSLTGNDVSTMPDANAPALIQLEFLDLRGNRIDFGGDAASSASVTALRERGVEVLTDPQILSSPEDRFADRRLQWLFDEVVATIHNSDEEGEAYIDRVRTIRIDLYEERTRALREAALPFLSDGNAIARARIESRILNPRAIESLSGIESLELLGTVHIDGTGITALPDLSQLQLLQFVNLDRNELSDLSGLTNATISSLDLDHNRIRDITPLGTLGQLVSLDVADNMIEDLSVLGQLTRLEVLDADENMISDVSGLVSNRNLQRIDLHGNEIRNYRFLDSFDQLREADLRSNRLAIGFGEAERDWLREKLSDLAEVFLYPQSGKRIPLLVEDGVITIPPLKKKRSFLMEESSDLVSWERNQSFFFGNSGMTQFALPVHSVTTKYYRLSSQ